jgi:hypothetical protein
MVKLFNQEWSRSELLKRVGNMDQLAGIRALEAVDGTARGCRMLEVWNGSGLRFLVNAERALDISSCEYRGIPLAWRSPVGDVHPAYYEPQETGWLRSFAGGLLTTCGLDSFGPPSQDGGQVFGLHGRIGNIPASQVNTRTYWEKDDYQLEISTEVRQARLFGENLVLRRRITTSLGSDRIKIEDIVSNQGYEPASHMLLYHFNLGFPLVGENARLNIHAEETRPRDAVAVSGLPAWNQFQAPTPGYQEQVFIHRPKVDEKGLAVVELSNPSIGISLRWRYSAASLPYLMEWKMMGEGAYVVGVEPANCDGIGGRAAARELGKLPMLEPGENRAYCIEVEIAEDYPPEVGRAAE